MKAKALLTAMLMLMSLFVFIAPYVPTTHAACCTLVQEKNNNVAGTCGAVSTCGITFNANVALNDLMVLNLYVQTAAAVGTCRTVVSVTEAALGNSFNLGNNNNCVLVSNTNLYEQEFVYFLIFTGNPAADTITATISGTATAITMSIQDFSGEPTTNLAATSTCKQDPQNFNNPGPGTWTCTSNVTWQGSPLILGEFFFGSGSTTSPGTGFAAVFNCATPTAGVCGEYRTSASSPSNVPYNVGCAACTTDESEVGLVLDSSNVTIVIAACTFFQLQCWWYPLLFMGLYSGYLLLVASFLHTSARGKSHVFLSALTFGSLVAVMLGIMNIVFPLLLIIINTLMILRVGR